MSKKQAGTITAAGRGIVESRVGVEAVTRVGRNPQVKGVVHEVLYRDLQNASAKNVVNGTKAVLTKSTTAVRDDILMKQGASIVGRAQLKDTPKAIAKTVSQVRSGHYAGTNLMGTTETVAAYNKAVANAAKNGVKITQQMTDTGISSLDTGRIATQTIGQAAGKLSGAALTKMAASTGMAGGLLSGGIEAVGSGIKLANGEIDGEEFAGNVARETVTGAASAAAASTAFSVVSAGAATALATTTAPLWLPAAAGVAVSMAVGGIAKNLLDGLFDL